MNTTKFLIFAKSKNTFFQIIKKMNNKFLFITKASMIVITALAFVSCGDAGGDANASGSTTSAKTPELNVTFNATNDSGTINFSATIMNSNATVDLALIEIHRNEVIVATSDQNRNLVPNQSFSFVTTDIPAEPGNYNYKVCIRDTSSNNFCSNEKSFALFPELSISLRADITSSNIDLDFTLIAEVTNDGSRFSPATQIDFFSSLSNTFDTSSNIGTKNIGSLSTEEATSSRVPRQESSVRNYFYRACVQSVLGERNTDNNCTNAIEIEIFGIADLSIDTIKVSSTDIEARIPLIISAKLKNIGSGDARVITIQFYRSIDSTISTADIFLASASVDVLLAGASMDVRETISSRLGNFYYGLCIERVDLRENIDNNCSHGILVNTKLSWQQATASAGWSSRNNHTSLVYNNKMWVLGGTDGSRLNDVWDSTDGINWTQTTVSAGWSGRNNHTSLVYNNKIWVLGGYDGSRKNDVWDSTDGINWTQTTASAGWSARSNHTSLVYNNKMWVLGGTNGFNDVWYSTDGMNWTQTTASADWSGRNAHTSLVYDNKMWVLGGEDGSSNRFNDVWHSRDGISWTQTTASADWSGRWNHTSLVYNNKIWVIGGARLNDVWYSTDGISWSQITANAGWSARRAHTSLVYNNKMWVLGGDTFFNKNDVWHTTASNDSIDTALSLSLTSSGNDYSSDTVVVNLQAGAENYYTFQLTTGNYIIETSSDIGTSCSLYNSERSIVMTDNNNGTNECQMTHTVTTTTDLYLQIKGNTTNTTGFYQLLIRKNTTSTARTSIRVAANTILQTGQQSGGQQSGGQQSGGQSGGQKIALTSSIQPQIQGRLEVQDPIKNEYGTVCSDSFGQQDVIVACRSLGFSDGYVIPSAQIEQGTGAILLDDLHCTGIEENLLDCQHNGIGVHNCTHSEDIGIACY